MPKDLTLESLDKSLDKSKKQELEQIKKIESENMSELAKCLRESLIAELHLIEKDINGEMRKTSKSLNRIKIMHWLAPSIMGFSLVAGLTLGSYALGSWITNDLKTIAETKKKREEIGNYHLIVKTYSNGIELKKKPQVWQEDNGNWIVIFDKGEQ